MKLYHNGLAKVTEVIVTTDPKTGKTKTKDESKQIALPKGSSFGGRPVRTVIDVQNADEQKALKSKGFDAPPKTVAEKAEKE